MTAYRIALALLLADLILLTYAYAVTGSPLAAVLLGVVIVCGARATVVVRRG